MRDAIASVRSIYAEPKTAPATADWQLNRLNELWRDIVLRSPYYARLHAQRALPARFSSWTEYSRTIPCLGRAELARAVCDMRLRGERADYSRTTGGSTSEPIQLPSTRGEDTVTGARTWYARSWFGVEPSDRLFLLWGHSHLLGTGLRGWLGAGRRALKDACLGYLRHSAYDLSDASLRRAGRSILRHGPRYIVGYSVALHRLAHVNRDLARDFHDLGLKVVIATGESFPFPNSAERISAVFGAPVAMEYGAVETGIIAHQDGSGTFRIFWDTCRIEAVESSAQPGAHEIVVTTLYPRLVPLLRYRLGDLVGWDPATGDLARGFTRIVGRCNDVITVADGKPVHSEAFSHVLRDMQQIEAFQVTRRADREIVIEYVADSPLTGEAVSRAKERLARVEAGLATAEFRQVPHLQMSIAGKTKRILDTDRGAP